jgi:hypothetical protein
MDFGHVLRLTEYERTFLLFALNTLRQQQNEHGMSGFEPFFANPEYLGAQGKYSEQEAEDLVNDLFVRCGALLK